MCAIQDVCYYLCSPKTILKLLITNLDSALQNWVVNCGVGVGVGWCDLGGWNTKLELELELELQSSSCGDYSRNSRWDLQFFKDCECDKYLVI